MAELRHLVNQRTQVKRQLTRFRTFCDAQDDNVDVSQLRLRLQKADSLLGEFNNVQTQIEQADEADGDVEERDAFEDSYFGVISQAQQIIEKHTAVPIISSGISETRSVNIKLPTLELPSFSGNYDKWLLYKDSFISLIHANDALHDVQKFQYLRSTLKGEALQLINSLETSAQNYAVAWKLIQTRYENKKLIVNTHVKALFDLPNITRENQQSLRQFIDGINIHVHALQALKQPTEHWDTLLIYLATIKLDFKLRQEWELHATYKLNDKMPSMDDLLEFLNIRCQSVEMTDKGKQRSEVQITPQGKRFDRKIACTSVVQGTCKICNKQHGLFHCEEFLKLSTDNRRKEVGRLQLCYNCLKGGHRSSNCKSSNCKKCHKGHNTLLHIERQTASNETPATSQVAVANEGNETTVATSTQTRVQSQQTSHVLLSTAQVIIYDADGKMHKCRALLDSGSQSNFITKGLCTKLKLHMDAARISVNGVNNALSAISQQTHVAIKSRFNNFSAEMTCLVLPTITSNIPQVKISKTPFKIPTFMKLADESFNIPGQVDLLIGASTFWTLLCVGQRKLGRNQPIMQRTQLGWVISGTTSIDNQLNNQEDYCFTTTINVDQQLEKFWHIEEFSYQPHYSPEELECEQHFAANTTRHKDGRFIVRLPRKQSNALGNSLKGALDRLHAIERRFLRQPQMKTDYVQFMTEYEQLNHMTIVPTAAGSNETNYVYYLPHHPVIKEDSVTTKLRVVFDGSAVTSSGISLNKTLMVGANVQDNLFNIIVRFRTHQYVVTADIAMMYRQIQIHEDDKHSQRIVWRSSTDQPVKHYTLNTVTYGTASAPYLATRCLKQLALEDGSKFPLAKDALLHDFYVDDVLTGAQTIEESAQLQKQLTQLLSLAQLTLRKWRSNHVETLRHLTDDSKESSLLILNKEEPIKTLGLLWNSQSDTFQYTVTTNEDKVVTKRTILSSIAQIYDPLGLVGPVITTAKIIMQQLWQLQLTWDEPVPIEMFTTWTTFYNGIPELNKLRIPRNVNSNNSSAKFDLHGFCDASESAYGACIYARSISQQGTVTTELLCSKSRVAPLQSISVPRLELCGALLLSKLMHTMQQALEARINQIHHWTDSTIVLAWLSTSPHQLKTFIANRVSKIQRLSENIQWQHVPSKENPADIISRGVQASGLLTSKLWWNGPEWLQKCEDHWPQQNEQNGPVLELNSSVVLHSVQNQFTLPETISSYAKLQRVIAYCQRFISNIQGKHGRSTGPLSVEELTRATRTVIKNVQQEVFKQEIADLRSGKPFNSRSRLLTLNIFLDSHDMLRVGGRLKNANISSDQRHPLLLPSKHRVTTLIMEEEHKKLLHCGVEQLLASTRLKYWPLSGRRVAKKITRNCIQCFRCSPKPTNYLMGNLPEPRVSSQIRPFVITGVDYAGPIQVRESRRRGRIHISKGYIAIFVCMATKAVHIELISDLTTAAFIAGLRRFIARRGICSEIHSDNGTNFVGANRELKELYNFVKVNNDKFAVELARQQITWKFIPPRAAHFGGLWEAAVKSTKRHLHRITRNIMYTFEEYYTLLTQIESCLNSRPITTLSSDPNDLVALTPAHFLIGDSLQEPSEPNYMKVPVNTLSRWEHIQQLRQHFWQRWHKEYLHQLQQRNKWTQGHTNLDVGTMVLIMEDNQPPLNWPIGRIVTVHPGSDNVVRVVTVKTASGTYKRPVRKVCALPKAE